MSAIVPMPLPRCVGVRTFECWAFVGRRGSAKPSDLCNQERRHAIKTDTPTGDTEMVLSKDLCVDSIAIAPRSLGYLRGVRHMAQGAKLV
jgi:hypothetical protein